EPSEAEIKNCAKVAIIYLEIAGLYFHRQINFVLNSICFIYVNFVKFLQIYMLISAVLFLLFSQFSLGNSVESIILIITSTVLLCKTSIYYFRREVFEYLINTLNKNFFIHKTYLSTENKQIIYSTLKLTKQFSIFYAILVHSGITFYADITPLITSENMTVNCNVTAISERKLQIPLWVPIDVATSKYYYAFYLFISILSHSVACIVVAVQIMFFTFMICLRGQFELLSDALRNLPENVIHRIK
ncbi:hypothetical protein L9F63_000408, partial [Diploptera punctata]